MSAPARSYSVARAGWASASLAYMTPTPPPHALTQLIPGATASVQAAEQEAGRCLTGQGQGEKRGEEWKPEGRNHSTKSRGRREAVVKTMGTDVETCTWEYALMTGVVANKPWMDQSAAGVQFAECCHQENKSRLIWRKLMRSDSQFGWKTSPRTVFVILDRFLFSSREKQYCYQQPSIAGLQPLFFLAAVTAEMIHNTLKGSQPLEHSPRRTHSPAQRRLWRYSGCRGGGQVESHRRSVCVLAADLNPGEGGRGGGGGGVLHTIHGLCHLCIGCRLPQVCVLQREESRERENVRRVHGINQWCYRERLVEWITALKVTISEVCFHN